MISTQLTRLWWFSYNIICPLPAPPAATVVVVGGGVSIKDNNIVLYMYKQPTVHSQKQFHDQQGSLWCRALLSLDDKNVLF